MLRHREGTASASPTGGSAAIPAGRQVRRPGRLRAARPAFGWCGRDRARGCGPRRNRSMNLYRACRAVRAPRDCASPDRTAHRVRRPRRCIPPGAARQDGVPANRCSSPGTGRPPRHRGRRRSVGVAATPGWCHPSRGRRRRPCPPHRGVRPGSAGSARAAGWRSSRSRCERARHRTGPPGSRTADPGRRGAGWPARTTPPPRPCRLRAGAAAGRHSVDAGAPGTCPALQGCLRRCWPARTRGARPTAWTPRSRPHRPAPAGPGRGTPPRASGSGRDQPRAPAPARPPTRRIR